MATNSSWSVGKRIAGLCAALIAMSVAIGLVGVTSVHKLCINLRGIAAESVPAIKQLTAIQALGLELRGTSLLMGTPGLASDYKTKQIAHLAELRAEIKERIAKYGDTVPSEERGAYRNLETATNEFMDAIDRFLALSLAGESREAGAFWSAKGGPVSKAFRKSLDKEVLLNQQITDRYMASGITAAHWATVISWALLALVVLVGFTAGWLMVRSTTLALKLAARDLREMAAEIANTSSQLASASERLADSSSRQAAGLEETSAAGRAISEGTKQNARNCQSAAVVMLETEAVVGDVNQRLDQSLAGMTEITDSNRQIASIMKVIDDIAFQTNILALNAAVEAARAGDAGLAFAVVADEVRNLSNRCAAAAEEVADSVSRSVESGRNGKAWLDDAAASVRDITTRALRAKELVRQIDDDARQQMAAVDQIATALIHMEETTQHTAAAAEEGSATSAELKAQVETMENVIGCLEALI